MTFEEICEHNDHPWEYDDVVIGAISKDRTCCWCAYKIWANTSAVRVASLYSGQFGHWPECPRSRVESARRRKSAKLEC